jgi:hypothetical protein
VTTTTDIKRQNTEHSPLPEPIHLFPDRKTKKFKIQRSKTAGSMPIIASKSRRTFDMI